MSRNENRKPEIIKVELVKGPPDGELVDALKYSRRRPNPFTVAFTDTRENVYTVRITRLGEGNGSDKSFVFKGELVSVKPNGRPCISEQLGDNEVKGFWDAGSPRYGWMSGLAAERDNLTVSWSTKPSGLRNYPDTVTVSFGPDITGDVMHQLFEAVGASHHAGSVQTCDGLLEFTPHSLGGIETQLPVIQVLRESLIEQRFEPVVMAL